MHRGWTQRSSPHQRRSLKVSSDQLYYAHSLILLVRNMLCSKLQCQKASDLIPCSYKISPLPRRREAEARRGSTRRSSPHQRRPPRASRRFLAPGQQFLVTTRSFASRNPLDFHLAFQRCRGTPPSRSSPANDLSREWRRAFQTCPGCPGGTRGGRGFGRSRLRRRARGRAMPLFWVSEVTEHMF